MQPIESLVPMVVTTKVEESRDFYAKHFDMEVTFDCGWYASLRSRSGAGARFELGFRAPREGERCLEAGLTLGLQVADADAELARLEELGAPIAEPIRDNPWGDRSFLLRDPNGLGLYVFHPIPPKPEYAPYQRG